LSFYTHIAGTYLQFHLLPSHFLLFPLHFKLSFCSSLLESNDTYRFAAWC
jgi:hypothetical protein